MGFIDITDDMQAGIDVLLFFFSSSDSKKLSTFTSSAEGPASRKSLINDNLLTYKK